MARSLSLRLDIVAQERSDPISPLAAAPALIQESGPDYIHESTDIWLQLQLQG